jgi:hypothetical protein
VSTCPKNSGIYANLSLSAVIVATLAACGSNIAPPTLAPTMSGKVINSYIYGAIVTLDSNDNGVCESTEPQVVSKIDGSYEFPGLGRHMVCSVGGYNTATNLPVVGEFRAPPGATVVTPLSTLVMARVGATTGAPTDLQVAAAQASLEIQLSLPAGSLALDPVAAISSNPKIEQTNAAVEVMLQTVASSVSAFAGVTAPAAGATALEKSNYTAAVNAVFANAVKAVTTSLASTTVDLTSAAGASVTDSFVQSAVVTTVDNVKTAVAASGGSNATATALNSAVSGAATAMTNTSSTNAAAFVAKNVSTVVQSVAQVTIVPGAGNAAANEAAIAAAATTAQQNVVIANSVEAVVTAAPTLFASTATAASAQVAALAQTVLPSASATSNAAFTANTTTVSAALTTAATSASVTVDAGAAATAVAADVAAPPAAPVVVNLTTVTLPVVPPLPDPIVITGATGGN